MFEHLVVKTEFHFLTSELENKFVLLRENKITIVIMNSASLQYN